MLSRILDPFLTAAEQVVRQVYFRSDRLQALRSSRARAPIRRELRLSQLRECLLQHGLQTGDIVMVHSGLSKISVVDDVFGQSTAETSAPIGAAKILALFRTLVGDEGTIILPTFPRYENERAYLSPENDGRRRDRYDPTATPSKSGLLTEIFRVADGSLRSRFPLQTVSANGPRAKWIIDGAQPGKLGGLAHGPDSPYGRLVEAGGLVVSVGVPLLDYCTVVHAAEDARYEEWPIRDFWRNRYFDVVDEAGTVDVCVLEREPKYSRGYAEELLRRDVRRHGVLREGVAGRVECHALRASDLYEMMMSKNKDNTYPFLWPRISAL